MDFSSLAAIVLGFTFLVAALSKFRDRDGFVLGILEYDVLPTRLAVAYGRVLPVLELIFGAALLAGVWPLGIGIGSVLLLLSFVAAVAVNLARRRQVDCHCFGVHRSEPIGWLTLARLGVLLVCALLISSRPDSSPPLLPLAGLLPRLLAALGIILGLYLLPAATLVWAIWRTKPIPAATLHGGRISLKSYPLRDSILGVSRDGVITTDLG
jgi:uncharacterized membrane protein YphA (DoxX/SURF4 family)